MPTHLDEVRRAWEILNENSSSTSVVTLDGEPESLQMAHIVAVARFSVDASILQSDPIVTRVQESIATLDMHLNNGEIIYGVNTGCGGNANTRTRKLDLLQKAFLQHHQAGILTSLPENWNSSYTMPHDANHHALPREFVRGAMLLRCNSLLRGHSAVRMEVIELLIQALNMGITPLIPARGSISASGDLTPLAYLGGLVEGNPDIFVQVGQKGPSNGEIGKEVEVMSAANALRRANITPLTLRAKEGLGVMNGTSPSAAAAALTLHDVNNITVLTQVLTAMATEALLGSVDNYDDFVSQCRPHLGQIEVARNIRGFLAETMLAERTHVHRQGLAQDRYALRTAPQWLGPVTEDLLLANRQITIELNSTTDNPLIDVAGDRFHHGGNFQAASVTSAMEKAKTALVMIGRLLVSQCQEIINPNLNKGLPPNLCFDDPNTSFTCKGIDINMTAYFSELAFLSNSVVSHVHVADLNNQSVNSLALIACRYAKEGVDIVTMMCAAHLYVMCQALDLRAMTLDFLATAKVSLRALYQEVWLAGGTPSFDKLWVAITESWDAHNDSDTIETRCEKVAADSAHWSIDQLTISESSLSFDSLKLFPRWRARVASLLKKAHEETRYRFLIKQSTPQYLAVSTKELYLWVRQTLHVPLHQGLVDDPGDDEDAKDNKTIGTRVSAIYTAIRDGRSIEPLQRATKMAF
ncbi:Phenylalanine ammonia-lyase [Penicillium expansum]|uniref:Phenylalanine ammonia-lyase n=1 Tax=Penicillium expansum TaxID=27334 RepID=A0A0A2JDX8_PENEN|nr:Phenylalanine ammonia-lyase [Penicillium expansum]KGO41244.1 Phenylalanine ammonia-lyase [Penicillium expansum]KGO50530.1 Phenylalanine ammonia-lyase [Penicillium expansum]